LILDFLLAALAFCALLPIVAPLLRGSRPVATRGSFDQAVYRDQLHELDRDIARGLVTQEDADAARLEIQRRLLAADKLPSATARLSRSPVLALIVFLVIAAGSIGSYLWIGAPGLPDEPFAARKAELAQEQGPSSLQKATEALAAKLKQNPADADGWLLYGRSLAMQNQWDQADDAYRHAIDLGRTSPDVLADHAEVLVMQAGGTVTPAAEAALRQVSQADPANPMARYYLAVAAMQAGEPLKAIAGFQAVLAQLPADSPLRAELGQKIADAAHAANIPVPELAAGAPPEPPAEKPPQQPPGPDADAMKAAESMPDAQRQAMINGMVAKLAAEQAANPNNLDGWLRLGRAYAVLHESDKAADAYEKAAELGPDDASIPLQEVRTLLADHKPADKLPPRVVQLLQRVEQKDPNEPMVLWYLGVAAVQDRRVDDARTYWTRLLTKLPPNSEDAKMIQSAIDALAKR
jgi:cytochrome c-type biogenesis protein CcmH